jgi:hypothetical protein
MITVMTTELDLSEIGVLIDRVEFVTKKGLTLKSPLDELSDGIKNFLTFWFDGDSEDSIRGKESGLGIGAPEVKTRALLNLGGEIIADDFGPIIIESPSSRQQSKLLF